MPHVDELCIGSKIGRTGLSIVADNGFYFDRVHGDRGSVSDLASRYSQPEISLKNWILNWGNTFRTRLGLFNIYLELQACEPHDAVTFESGSSRKLLRLQRNPDVWWQISER
ncbi:hypothetical protein GCM10011410_02490 [Hoyosella rhizosphaerae]|uniref:Uncharacterized protein n=1 Tax=Hoyosella rhizosphaerae TaxID=1755582 RepID=A0A916U050_9ACTN|nr:hypothetical protein GCM10011410_02490 [Hoyosella rhizosphaerae]